MPVKRNAILLVRYVCANGAIIVQNVAVTMSSLAGNTVPI